MAGRGAQRFAPLLAVWPPRSARHSRFDLSPSVQRQCGCVCGGGVAALASRAVGTASPGKTYRALYYSLWPAWLCGPEVRCRVAALPAGAQGVGVADDSSAAPGPARPGKKPQRLAAPPHPLIIAVLFRVPVEAEPAPPRPAPCTRGGVFCPRRPAQPSYSFLSPSRAAREARRGPGDQTAVRVRVPPEPTVTPTHPGLGAANPPPQASHSVERDYRPAFPMHTDMSPARPCKSLAVTWVRSDCLPA